MMVDVKCVCGRVFTIDVDSKDVEVDAKCPGCGMWNTWKK